MNSPATPRPPCSQGIAAAPPAPVAVTETFEAPFRVSDMTAVLVEAAAEPIPVRGNDGSLYVRAQKALAAHLLRLPAWAQHDWFGGTRRVRIRPAVLVECPDTETAARVTALGGEQVTAVTRTLLRLDGDAKSAAALVKKLRAKGIFVQE